MGWREGGATHTLLSGILVVGEGGGGVELSYCLGKTMQIGGEMTQTGGMLHAMSVIHSQNMPQVIHSSYIMPVIHFSFSCFREFCQSKATNNSFEVSKPRCSWTLNAFKK